MTTNALLDAIRECLSQPSGVVQVVTHTRATEYRPKHIDWFSAREGEEGVYVQSGKRKLYCFPYVIRIGHYVTR